MPEKETFHDHMPVHPFHHPGHPGHPHHHPGLGAGANGATTAGYPPLQLPSAFVAFHTQLPTGLDSPHDGRYLWDSPVPVPPTSSFHHHHSATG